MIRIGEAADRVRRYLDERVKHTGLAQDSVHALNYGDPREVELFTADLRVLTEQSEAVKRLVEDHIDLCCAMHDLMAEIGAPAWALEKLRKSAVILAPFTDSDVALVDSGLRSCATPENDGSTPPKGADQ